tara:strand:- start:245 stop:454 length:210 start_codon:yes stop_codon:yes gene_type:complete
VQEVYRFEGKGGVMGSWSTMETREKLASQVVEDWADDEVRRYAKRRLKEEYVDSQAQFEMDWELTFEGE